MPYCRKKYPDIYFNNIQEELVFAEPTNYEINIIKQSTSQFESLNLKEHENDLCNFYEVFINHGDNIYQISFIILHTHSDANDAIPMRCR